MGTEYPFDDESSSLFFSVEAPFPWAVSNVPDLAPLINDIGMYLHGIWLEFRQKFKFYFVGPTSETNPPEPIGHSTSQKSFTVQILMDSNIRILIRILVS